MKDQYFDVTHTPIVSLNDVVAKYADNAPVADLSVSFSADFHVEVADAQAATAIDHVQKSFQNFLTGRIVAKDEDSFGEEVLSDLAAGDAVADYVISNSLMNSIVLDQELPGGDTQFFSITAAPEAFDGAMSKLLEVTDKMSSDEFKTSAPTELAVQVRLTEEEGVLDPLVLAMASNEILWLNRFARAGRVLPSEVWIKKTLSGSIINEYFRLPVRLSARDDLKTWRAHLSGIVEDMMADGRDGDCVCVISPDRTSVNFYHIGGEAYGNDIALLFATINEMTKAVSVATMASDQVTMRNSASLLLRAFVDRILNLQETAEEFEFADSDEKHVAKAISSHETEVGAVRSTPCSVNVGGMAVLVDGQDENAQRAAAALLWNARKTLEPQGSRTFT